MLLWPYRRRDLRTRTAVTLTLLPMCRPCVRGCDDVGTGLPNVHRRSTAARHGAARLLHGQRWVSTVLVCLRHSTESWRPAPTLHMCCRCWSRGDPDSAGIVGACRSRWGAGTRIDRNNGDTGRYYWFGEHDVDVVQRGFEDYLLDRSTEQYQGGLMACSTNDMLSWKNEGTMVRSLWFESR